MGTKILCCLGSFLRNGNICGASCAHSDFALVNLIQLLYFQNPGKGIVLNLGEFFPHKLILRLGCSGSQHFALLMVQSFKNFQQMLICLIAAIDYLRKTGTGFPACIQFGIIHFFISILSDHRPCCVRGKGSLLHLGQYLFQCHLSLHSLSAACIAVRPFLAEGILPPLN